MASFYVKGKAGERLLVIEEKSYRTAAPTLDDKVLRKEAITVHRTEDGRVAKSMDLDNSSFRISGEFYDRE